jgi:hypothetical protein
MISCTRAGALESVVKPTPIAVVALILAACAGARTNEYARHAGRRQMRRPTRDE